MLQQTHNIMSSQVRRHLIFMHELIRITSSLSQMHIDYIVLKGIPLNQLLYGKRLVRKSRDIDILIQVKDIASVHQYLVTQGYELQSSVPIDALIREATWLTRFLDEILYWHPHKNIALDLKWHHSTRNSLGMSWCNIKSYTEIDINTHKIRTLKPAQNFYYLCTHAAKHHWEYGQWLEDLAVFSQKIPFYFDTVVSLAQETKTIRTLLEASILLQQHCQIKLGDIPDFFWDNMLVNLRLSCIRSQWFTRLLHHQKFKRYVSIVLDILLYPKFSQKYHYIQRLFILRVASLRQLSRLKKPKPYKMIFFSFWPIDRCGR